MSVLQFFCHVPPFFILKKVEKPGLVLFLEQSGNILHAFDFLLRMKIFRHFLLISNKKKETSREGVILHYKNRLPPLILMVMSISQKSI